MEVRAVSKYIRISPRKTRLVADIIRGKNALESQQVLETVNKRAARVISKTLNSAISNARQKEIKEDSLWIKKILIDGGPLYKRYMPRAMGRATMIRRPTSHVTVILSDEKGTEKIKTEEAVKDKDKGKLKAVDKVKNKVKGKVRTKE